MLLRKYLPALLGGSAALALAAGTLVPAEAAYAPPSSRTKTQVAFKGPARADDGTVAIYNALGERRLSKARKGANVAARDARKPVYAHAVFERLPDHKTYEAILEAGKMRLVSMVFSEQGDKTYELWKVNLQGQEIGAVRERLAARFPDLFFNLEPYTVEDRLTPRLKGREPLREGQYNGKANTIFACVDFFEDVPEKERERLLKGHIPPENFTKPGGDAQFQASHNTLLKLAEVEGVSRVRECDADLRTTLAESRKLVKADEVQAIDHDVFPPTSDWLDTGSYLDYYFGRGVTVSTGELIDTVPDKSSPDDFKEWDGSETYTRKADPMSHMGSWADPGMHGNHVAGIVGGNGWNSNYHWRGVAPKVKFTDNGHIRTHSYIANWGTYEATDKNDDAALHDHSYTRTSIWAAANNGHYNSREWLYGPQKGYYSLLVNAKNPTIVANVYGDTALRATNSSLGPTRDGRIKPDVAAPGSSYAFPDRKVAPLVIEIDYIHFLRSDNSVAKGFDFTSDNEGWVNLDYMSEQSVTGGVITFHNANTGIGKLKNPSVSGYTAKPGDKLKIRYRMSHPHIPGKVNALSAGISWNTTDWGDDSLVFKLSVPNTSSFQTATFNLASLKSQPTQLSGIAKWPGGDSAMTSLVLSIASDTSGAIMSTNSWGSTGAPRYFESAGTSMAAPHVAGITALMLEKWARLFAVSDLHTEGPWNSTTKAILVHTATDLVKTEPDQHESRPWPEGRIAMNPDLCVLSGWNCTRETSAKGAIVKYYEGPDYATGYGLVNAKKALQYTNADSVLQDSAGDQENNVYEFTMPSGRTQFRATLAWDDRAGDNTLPFYERQLMNDLDLVVEDPTGKIYEPWWLEPLPQSLSGVPSDGLDPIDSADVRPAHKGTNILDNLEVVDIETASGTLPTGTWRVHVRGSRVHVSKRQDFSLVTDQPVARLIAPRVGWLHKPFRYDPVSETSTYNDCAEGSRMINTSDEGTQNLFSDSLRFTGATGPWYEAYAWPPIHSYYSYGVRINVCPETRATLPRAKYDYAVLQLSDECPTNGVSFARVIQDEHAGAATDMGPLSLAPSTYDAVTGTTTIRFCYVKGDGISTTPPPWKQKDRGALHSPVQVPHADCQTMLKHHVVDGNNLNNANSYIWPSTWPSPTTVADSTAIKNNFFRGAGPEANGYTSNTCGVDWE